MAEPDAPIESADSTLLTLDKGLTILEGLASLGRDGASAAELARRLGWHRTTVYRFLQTLARRGYAEPMGATDRYRIGIKALALASASMAGLSCVMSARPCWKR